jgi:polysaccharide export outer membrane protein
MRFDLLIRRTGVIAAPALVLFTLTGCGSGLNEGMSAMDAGPSAGATASLGMQPPSTSEPVAAAPKASAKLMREVRALESTVTPGSDGYRIGPQDVLEISVFQAPELAKSVQVAETGMINLPLVGDVKAGGVTARQLEQDLKAKYGSRYLQNPQITVFIREFNSQRVTLEGAVERPGVYPYRGPSTLLQLVASAGGMKEVADGSEVMVFRTATGRKEAARFDVDAIKAGRAADPTILQGDVVIVGTSAIKKLYQDVLKSLPVVGMFGGLL